jgi:hypothetical protein
MGGRTMGTKTIKEMKKFCRHCPYLITDDKNEWICDLRQDLKCIDQHYICKEEEKREQVRQILIDYDSIE